MNWSLKTIQTWYIAPKSQLNGVFNESIVVHLPLIGYHLPIAIMLCSVYNHRAIKYDGISLGG